MRYRVHTQHESGFGSSYEVANLLHAIRCGDSTKVSIPYVWITDSMNNTFLYLRHRSRRLWPLVWEQTLSTPNQRKALWLKMKLRQGERFTDQPVMEKIL